jgi:hypothetical protein
VPEYRAAIVNRLLPRLVNPDLAPAHNLRRDWPCCGGAPLGRAGASISGVPSEQAGRRETSVRVVPWFGRTSKSLLRRTSACGPITEVRRPTPSTLCSNRAAGRRRPVDWNANP